MKCDIDFVDLTEFQPTILLFICVQKYKLVQNDVMF